MPVYDDDAWCWCCLGIAIGAVLFGGSQSNGQELNKPNCDHKHKTETVVESKNLDDVLLRQIENYQKNISPQLKERLGKEKLCKFTPSCSEYARQAIEEYGSFKGSLMAAKRLCKCNPLTKGGYDPVKKNK